jgi:hypothetical protein
MMQIVADIHFYAGSGSTDAWSGESWQGVRWLGPPLGYPSRLFGPI